jgi:hypothetical protein
LPRTTSTGDDFFFFGELKETSKWLGEEGIILPISFS